MKRLRSPFDSAQGDREGNEVQGLPFDSRPAGRQALRVTGREMKYY
ncbi:MAG: hypothetical protein AB9842_04435 [Bacteroidales bacterium]